MDKEILEIYKLKIQQKVLEAQIEKLKVSLKTIETQITEDSASVLKEMQQASNDKKLDANNSYIIDNIVTTLMYRSSVNYTNEDNVVKWLKDNKYTDLFKTVITESLDKNKIKSALKKDKVLDEGLKPFIQETKTPYVVITTVENNEKMREHINENKKGK